MGDHTQSASKMTALNDDYTGASELAKEALVRGVTPATSVSNLSNASSLSSMAAIRRYAAGGDSLASLASDAPLFKMAAGGDLASSAAKFPSTVSLGRAGGFKTPGAAMSTSTPFQSVESNISGALPKKHWLQESLNITPSQASSLSNLGSRATSTTSLASSKMGSTLSRGKRALDDFGSTRDLLRSKHGLGNVKRLNYADVSAKGPQLEGSHWTAQLSTWIQK